MTHRTDDRGGTAEPGGADEAAAARYAFEPHPSAREQEWPRVDSGEAAPERDVPADGHEAGGAPTSD